MSSLNGTLHGGLVDPEDQAILDQILSTQRPNVKIDFSSERQAIENQAPPTQRPVPGVASPMGMFLSLLAANLGSTLTRRPEMANATIDLLSQQKQRQQQVEDANTEAMDNFHRGLDKDKLNLFIKQHEMELEQAINNGDKDAATKSAALLKILEDRLDRRAAREQIAQRGGEDRATDAARIKAQGAKEQAMFKFKETFKASDIPGFGKLDKATQKIAEQIIRDNNRIILMSAVPHFDPTTGTMVPASVTVAEALRQQRENAKEIIKQFGSDGSAPSTEGDPLGLRRGK
jgi:hypothetical protein